MNGIRNDGSIGIFTDAEELLLLRHTAAHILAQALKRLYPNGDIAGAEADEKGFYCDIDTGDSSLSADVLPHIEEAMHGICREALPVRPFMLPREKAIQLMAERQEPYQQLLIAALPQGTGVQFFRQGEFLAACKGPHLTYTNLLKHFALTGVSGAYWMNDSKNKMLTRVRGTAFLSHEELNAYLTFIAEAERRDHRKLGREMELFLLREEAPGFPFFLSGGLQLKNALIEYWRQLHRQNGYVEVATPLIMHRSLWETSGHWEHYRDIMYAMDIDGDPYCVKPMSCPGSLLIYNSRPRSYRELPMRICELGSVHRNELRGTLHGLFRVRCFTQDDAHIFLRQQQISSEIGNIVRLIHEIYQKFGFSYTVELSTRPENSMGSDKDWEEATQGLKQALEQAKLPYVINEGDGAFYGPKIDFHLQDSLGRTWQCGTIQLDFQMPLNFDLMYTDENGDRQRPIMLHRACFGSLERFIGILTEHYAGKFPLWLAPVQVKVLPVSQKSCEYAKKVFETIQTVGIRAVLDDRDAKIGYKIRQAQTVDRVPYMIILGQREAENETVSLRSRDSSETRELTVEMLLRKLQQETLDRA